MQLTDKEIKALTEMAKLAASAHPAKFGFSMTRQSQCGEPVVTTSGVLGYAEEDGDDDEIIRTPIFRLTQTSTEQTILDPRYPEKPLHSIVRHKG